MATVEYDFSRSDDVSDLSTAAGEAITNDFNFTFEDTMSKQEIIVALEKVKNAVLRDDEP